VRRVWAIVAVLAVVAATAAVMIGVRSSGGTTPDASDPRAGANARAERLWDSRTAYVGSNSKVTALVENAGFADAGPYALTLRTEARPYGVTIRYIADTSKVTPTGIEPSAFLLLGTVSNLQEVRVLAGSTDHVWTAAEASRRLGYDVKVFGKDRSKLAAYVRASFG
jgi:hypothetical protein